MKLVTGIVRTTSLEHVVHALERIGVRGMTISEIRGLGEEVRLNNPYSIHDKIELIVPDERADAVADAIIEHSRSGLEGDGVVTVAPLDSAVEIRTKKRMA